MIRQISAVITTLALLTGCLFAQGPSEQVRVEIKKIDVKRLETPQYQVTANQSKGKSRHWFGITAEYDTELQWTDELTFTFYVLLENSKDPRAVPSLLKAKLSYVNIEKGRGHKSDVYIHPSTIARFGEIKKVAVLVESKGRTLMTYAMPQSSVSWWSQLSPSDGLLMSRSQSPFAMINFDDYEMLKPESGQ